MKGSRLMLVALGLALVGALAGGQSLTVQYMEGNASQRNGSSWSVLSIGDTVIPVPTGAPVGVNGTGGVEPAVATGRYEILAELYDLRPDVPYNWPMAPYSIRVSLDGKEIRAIVFDSLRVKDGRAVLGATDLDRDDVYRSDGFVRLGVADLQPGQTRLEISVRDYAGNETVFETAFTIQ